MLVQETTKDRRPSLPVTLAALLSLMLLCAGVWMSGRVYRPTLRRIGPWRISGNNGLWLHYSWYFGRRSEAETHALAMHLARHHVRYAFFHVRFIGQSGRLKFHYPNAARTLVRTLHRDAPGLKALAWIYAGNVRGEGHVMLEDPSFRQRMVQEAVWLTTECGFDGVQWDYEVCATGDPGFPLLLKETRSAMPHGRLLWAATPLWLPERLRRWGWGDEDFRMAAALCDGLAVMCYDSSSQTESRYNLLMREQAMHATASLAESNPRCQLLFGVPVFHHSDPAHHSTIETLGAALQGLREGLADPAARPHSCAGLALFADYTAFGEDWRTYDSEWRGFAGKGPQLKGGR